MAPISGVSALQVTQAIPLLTAFLQGLLSFFSPCVLPLLPVYLGYLAGGSQEKGPQGEIRWPRGMVFRNTCFFVLGISAALLILGFTFTALGRFFRQYETGVNLVCGLLVVLFGLLQLGVIGRSSPLQGEYRFSPRLDRLRMNPATAWLKASAFPFPGRPAWAPPCPAC